MSTPSTMSTASKTSNSSSISADLSTSTDRNTSTNNTADILSLPDELLELITTEVETFDHCDLLTLRLACRKLQKASFKSFARAWFQERPLRLSSEKSLRQACEIASTVVLGPMARRLTISIDRHQSGGMVSPAARKEAAIRASRLDVTLLTTLFRRLRSLNIQVKISVTTNTTEQIEYHNSSALAPLCIPRPNDCAAFNTIVESLKSAQYAPRDFSLGIEVDSETWYLPIHKLVETRGLGDFQQVFTAIESLTLDVWVQDEDDVASSTAFFKALASFPHLESLTIYGHDLRDKQLRYTEACGFSIAEVLLEQDFATLKTLKLWHCTVFAGLLVKFLRRHSKQHKLEQFYMGRLEFEGTDFDWEDYIHDDEDEDVAERLQESLDSGLLSFRMLRKMTGVGAIPFDKED